MCLETLDFTGFPGYSIFRLFLNVEVLLTWLLALPAELMPQTATENNFIRIPHFETKGKTFF
jgi:hypothetical protein